MSIAELQEEIEKERRRRGITRKSMAKHMGMHPSLHFRKFTGETEFHLDDLLRACEFFGWGIVLVKGDFSKVKI